MSLDRAREHLKKYGLDKNIIELSESSATVELAAHALHTSEAQIAKTLGFFVEDNPILIVLRGDAKIDNSKFKKFFGKKGGHMIQASDVNRVIGHDVGGVCPFGIEPDVTVYLDVSLKDFDIVYPAAGSTNSAVKLTIEELERSSNYKEWIDVAKVKNDEL